MFTLNPIWNCITIPRSILLDNRVSLEAKGLYSMIFVIPTTETNDIENIKKYTFSSIEDISKALKELEHFGYIDKKTENGIDVYNIHLRGNSNTSPFKPVTNNRPNKAFMDQLYKEFDKRNYSEDLRKALVEYFEERLAKRPGSRYENDNLTVYRMITMLNELDSLDGNKAKIVDYCKAHQYYKFFNPGNMSLLYENIKSNSYTKEDAINIKNRSDALEALGEDAYF